MAYDIFDTYKKRLKSSKDRFTDVPVQPHARSIHKTREDIFDEGFKNVYGIELNEDYAVRDRSSRKSYLKEDFGSIPTWLKDFLDKNKAVAQKLAKRGVDLANMTFISGQLPRNARDPAFKDDSRIAVFRMVDAPGGKYEVIYIPGIVDPDVYPDPDNRWTRYKASLISKKKLLELTLEYGYIDMNDSRNSNTELRKSRAAARSGMVDRDRSSGQIAQKTNIEYATHENGRRNWDKIVSYDIKWVTKRGYDKSGYRLDPDKYGRMLDNVGLEDYSVRLEMLYKKIEAARTRLIDLMTKYTAADSMKLRVKNSYRNNIFGDIASIADDFSRAIDAYRDLQQDIDRIVNDPEMDDEEKNRRIGYTFSYSGKRVRDYLNSVASAAKVAETAEQI